MAMRLRLHFIRYFYSELISISIGAEPFWRPMWYEFYKDIYSLHANEQNNFMISKAIKISIDAHNPYNIPL